MKKATRRGLVAGVTLELVGIVGLNFFTTAFFAQSSFCRLCGEEQQISHIFWIPVEKTRPTRLSGYLASVGYPPGHKHEWLFAGGGGGTILCAIGDGRHLLNEVHGEDSVRLLEGLHRYLPGEFDLYVKRLLDTDPCAFRYFISPDDISSREKFNERLADLEATRKIMTESP